MVDVLGHNVGGHFHKVCNLMAYRKHLIDFTCYQIPPNFSNCWKYHWQLIVWNFRRKQLCAWWIHPYGPLNTDPLIFSSTSTQVLEKSCERWSSPLDLNVVTLVLYWGLQTFSGDTLKKDNPNYSKNISVVVCCLTTKTTFSYLIWTGIVHPVLLCSYE